MNKEEFKKIPNDKSLEDRIKNLEAQNIIIGYTTIFNDALLGLNYYKILMYLHEHDPQTLNEVNNYLKSTGNLIFITEGVGLADYEFEILLKHEQDVHNFMKELRQRFPGLIRDYDAMEMLDVYKSAVFGMI